MSVCLYQESIVGKYSLKANQSLLGNHLLLSCYSISLNPNTVVSRKQEWVLMSECRPGSAYNGEYELIEPTSTTYTPAAEAT